MQTRNNTAAGPFEITVQLIDQLGIKCNAQRTRATQQGIKTKEILTGWRESRTNFVYKGKCDNNKTNSYTPVKEASVVYRITMQAIRLKLSKWVEKNDILGELQHLQADV